jgi:hypothetical protein
MPRTSFYDGRVEQPATRIALAGLVAVLAGCGATQTVTVTRTVTVTTTISAPATAAACSGGDLGGSFRVVPGSPGAGQITYTLTLTNSSPAACYVTGIPQLQLLDAQGGALPTTVSAAHPGQATAAKIVLQPGESAKADARFSPDVPGTGEQTQGPCEPTAHRVKVAVGGGSVTVPVTPPTPVCEHGALSMSVLAAA